MRLLVILAFLPLGCFPMESQRQYPSWARVDSVKATAGCLELDGWVVQSGKQGLGLTLQATTRSDACPFAVKLAEVEIGAERVIAKSTPEPAMLHRGQTVWLYLPFVFDGDRAWNEERRSGLLHLGFDGGEVRWPIVDTMRGRYECEDRR